MSRSVRLYVLNLCIVRCKAWCDGAGLKKTLSGVGGQQGRRERLVKEMMERMWVTRRRRGAQNFFFRIRSGIFFILVCRGAARGLNGWGGACVWKGECRGWMALEIWMHIVFHDTVFILGIGGTIVPRQC